jgi:outer membrane protein OmpA-like peptidoglycan-associated protein
MNKSMTGAGLGAATGAGIGALVSKDKTKGALIGAAAGALLGGGIGYYLDNQAQQLQQSLQGTGYQVQRQPDAVKVVVPSSVSFATDSAQLLPAANQALNSVAQVVSQDPGATLDIIGHTDSRGNAAHNQTLSTNRAQAVAGYLASQGIAANRIRTRGVGSSQPIADNNSEEGRANNRRVEITIHPGKQAGQQQ